MLILTRKLNEKILIGHEIEISVVEIKGDQVKLGINAPRTVKVYRQEVYQAIQEENRAALGRQDISIPSLDEFLPEKQKPEKQKGNKPGQGRANTSGTDSGPESEDRPGTGGDTGSVQ